VLVNGTLYVTGTSLGTLPQLYVFGLLSAGSNEQEER